MPRSRVPTWPLPRPSSSPKVATTAGLLGLSLALLLGPAPPVEASPPEDDWTIETRPDDEKLVKQRFTKLKANPFDGKQWRALEKALGRGGLIRRIESASDRAPSNVALQILRAKGEMLQGDAQAAAERLAKLDGKSSKWDRRVFDMRVDALEQAKSWADAIDALAAKAKSAPKEAERLLERAHKLADRASMHDRALELAETLAAKKPNDASALVRVARAARAAGEHAASDAAYEKAIAKAKGDARNELVAERARAQIDAGNTSDAAKLLWDLLDDTKRGRADQRESWWDDLETCYRKEARSEVLVDELETWLEDPKHGKEVGGWQALARAQKAAGQNPIPALKRAIDLAPRDPVARAALIEALEEQGQSEAALEQYRELRGRSPEEVRLGLEMAERLVTNGERDTGLEIAGEIRQNGARDRDTLLLLIEFYNNVDERDLALETAKSLVKVAGRSPEARIALGEQLWEMGQRKEALAQWEQLPKLVRPGHLGWYRHAEILADHSLMDRGLRDTALDSLEKALGSRPNEPTYLRLQAMLEEERNRPDRALEIWEKVRDVAQEPAQELLRAEARTRIVELLAGPGLPNRSEKRAKAVAAAEAALGKGPSPEALEAGLFLAELYSREENYSGAVQMYTKLRDLFPSDPDRLMELAIAQRRAGLPSEAVRTLEKLLPLSPSREVDVLVMLTELSHELDKPEEARQAAINALEQGSSGIRALLRLGELSERRGEIDQAMWCYQTVLDAHPDHARTRMRLAELQLTTGDIEGAARSFRDLLEAGGPSDLMREAGARALDLAEVTDSIDEVLELAVKRTKREPNADEPRDFLLSTLDRVDYAQVELWLRDGAKVRDDNRIAAMRRPLVAALSRGSINNRMSAAEHLGELGLPDTAVHLARTGANLQPPRNATHAVRQRFIAARVAATHAAGELDDPESIPVMAEMVDDRGVEAPIRHAAFWALARSSNASAAGPLRRRIRASDDEIAITLSCLGLARLSRDDQRVEDLVVIDRIARESTRLSVRRACTFAAAALTPDFRVVRLHPQLHDEDPFVAAIAAWRIGQIDRTKLRDDGVEALFHLYFGPGGLARDAAIASLARLLGPEPGPGGVSTPPVPRQRTWDTVVERWLVDHLAPSVAALEPSDLDGQLPRVLAAWRASMTGTRAELSAARQAARACDAAPSVPSAGDEPETLCLEPLVRGSVDIPR
ncbi:tetratricopeptide repeat protein [Enhygromyxa salina]|uniref:Tetratricopeptide repeat protein n=1 Tax=Enhygromyxa salina TaxID=215803 RepID=A0A2S9XKX5_9BACT|nr:tetratricopeptide repeat protein [Enhygromyxa salina]PRP93487.1 tetratricopeptide repeat protein [Enhygromyxa salina]